MSARILVWLIALVVATQAAPLSWNSLTGKMKGVTVGALAGNDSTLAVGYSAGGVRLFNTAGVQFDSLQIPEFGARQRIYSLAWWKNWLLIASEGGLTVWDLHRHQIVVHMPGFKLGFSQAGAYSLALRGSDLWVGGLGTLSQLNLEQKRLQSTWNIPGNPGRVQCVLILGGSAYVGTESMGVRVLEMASGSWKGFDRFDGLPDNGITGLALVGPQIYVGTLQGLGRIDLALDAANTVNTDWIVTYLKEQNGILLLNTLDGLCIFNGSSQKGKVLELQNKLQTVGDLAVWNGAVLTGSDGKGLVKIPEPAQVLSSEELAMLPEGFTFLLHAEQLTDSMKIAVRLWYPERAGASISLNAIPGTSPEERLVRLPDDAVGNLVIELGVFQGGRLLERRTIPMNRDRTLPNLEMEGVPPFVRDSILQIRGHVVSKSLASLTFSPGNRKVKISTQGDFEGLLLLKPGLNTFELVAKNQASNEVRYPIQTTYDGDAPKVKWTQSDTVTESTVHWELPMLEPHLKQVQITPTSMAVVSTTDSLLLLTFHNLQAGPNPFSLKLEDEAGNVMQKNFTLLFQDDRARIVQSMEVQARAADKAVQAQQTRVDTVFRCATPVPDTTEKPMPTGANVGIHMIRYHLLRGETLRMVAEKFYGDREMYVVIAKYNHITDSEDLYHLPLGKALLIPIWENFQYGTWNVPQGLKNFEKAVGK